MKKKNNTHLVNVSLFVSCTAQVALWGGDNSTPSEQQYPYKVRLDIVNNLFIQNKTCLIHDGHVDQNNKVIPGFVSPTVSPQTSPEKIKPKQKTRGARGVNLKPGLACDLFNVQGNDASHAQNNDRSSISRDLALQQLEKYNSPDNSLRSMLPEAKIDDVLWKDRETVADVAQKLSVLILQTQPLAKDAPYALGKTIQEWRERLDHLEDHLANNCDEDSIGFSFLIQDFKTPTELSEQIDDALPRIDRAYKWAKELRAQESPRYKAED